MILKIGLAVKRINDFQQLLDDSGVQVHILTQKDIQQLSFFTSLLDIIIWQPEFSQGKFPEELSNYLIQNDTTTLVIYNIGKSELIIPDRIEKNLISVLEDPIRRHTLRLLLYNTTIEKKKESIYTKHTFFDEKDNHLQLIGNSIYVKKMNEFVDFISKSSNTHCLIRGETGTERDKIAPLIHKKSKKPLSLFECINCSRLTNDEILLKIFGAEFNTTKNQENIKGILERLDAGTLVLDNIEYIGEETQRRLEVFFETHSFRRVGSKTDLRVNVRIIATTEFDLEKFVTHSHFSRDLFFRFKAFELTIPPLRKRKSDILPLTKHFINYYNNKFGHSVRGITPEAEEKLINYLWPGNIDELRLVIQRAVLLCKKGEITVIALSDDLSEREAAQPEINFLGNCSLQEIEKLHIKKVLVRTKGNKSKAAKILNISRTTLREKMRSFELI